MTDITPDNPMAGFTANRPEAMRKRVYEYLRNEIAGGSLLPGTRLVETELGAAAGVSRTPIREALHLLEREGLVESSARVGYRVRTIQWEEVEEICEIRTVNEILAAQWAAKRLGDAELALLETNVAASEAAIATNSIGRIAELDAEFHESMAWVSGSDRLSEICQNLRRHMVLFRMETFRDPNLARLAVTGHRRVLECVKAGDAEEIADAVRAHLLDAKHAIGQFDSGETPK